MSHFLFLKMMTKLENDNLTEVLSKWKDGEGIKSEDLSAISLYKEFIAESSVDGPVLETYSETASELIQMVQGTNSFTSIWQAIVLFYKICIITLVVMIILHCFFKACHTQI